MSRVGFERTVPASARAKTVDALYRLVTVTGDNIILVTEKYYFPDDNVTVFDTNLKFLEISLNAHQYRLIMLGDSHVTNYGLMA
jgi:hypothetical protein